MDGKGAQARFLRSLYAPEVLGRPREVVDSGKNPQQYPFHPFPSYRSCIYQPWRYRVKLKHYGAFYDTRNEAV